MKSSTKWLENPTPGAVLWSTSEESPRLFHESFPEYRATPLTTLDGLAQRLGIRQVFVKNESERLGLPAFKMLGASWALCRLVAEHASAPEAMHSLIDLQAVAQSLGDVSVVCATDGNHGRAVARM